MATKLGVRPLDTLRLAVHDLSRAYAVAGTFTQSKPEFVAVAEQIEQAVREKATLEQAIDTPSADETAELRDLRERIARLKAERHAILAESGHS